MNLSRSPVFCLLSLILLLCNIVFAQSDTAVFLLPELKIFDNVEKSGVNVHFEEKNNKFSLFESLLVADTGKYNYSVNINSIRKIGFRNGTNFWGGAAIGAVVGFVAGFFAGGYFGIDGPVVFHFAGAFVGAALFSIPFAGAGGLIGLLSPKYDEYELTGSDLSNKRSQLYRILKKNRIKDLKE